MFLQSSSIKSGNNLRISRDKEPASSNPSSRRLLSIPLNYVQTREVFTVNLILALPESIIMEITSFLARFDQSKAFTYKHYI